MSNPVGAQRYGLGGGDAYYDAVKYGGYTGTREQFGRDQAEFAQNATAVAQAREEVERNTQTVVNTAQTFTEETVPEAIQSVEEKGDTEEDRLETRTTELVQSINTAGAVQVQAVEDEGTKQIRLVSGAGTVQVEAVKQAGSDQVDAVEAAGSTQVGNVNNAGTTQVGNVNNAGSTQVGNVNTAGAAQVQAVEDKGEEVLESIPSDYTELTEDVNNLGTAIKTGKLYLNLDNLTWKNGYVNNAGVIKSSSLSKFALIPLHEGDVLTVGTLNTNITLVGSTLATDVNVGDTVTVIETTTNENIYQEYTYTARTDINIVVSVLASNYNLSVEISIEFVTREDIGIHQSRNIFNVGWRNGVINNGVYSKITTGKANLATKEFIPVDANTGYIASFDGEMPSSTYLYVAYYSDESEVSFISASGANRISTLSNKVLFTTPQNTTHVRFLLYHPDMNIEDFTPSNFQVCKGNTKYSFVSPEVVGAEKIDEIEVYNRMVADGLLNGTIMQIPSYYETGSYMANKAARINELCKECVGHGDAFIFISDQHWEINQRNSPALINYIANNTKINRLFSGGDVADATSNIESYCEDLRRAFPGKIYHVTGNHDWFYP